MNFMITEQTARN